MCGKKKINEDNLSFSLSLLNALKESIITNVGNTLNLYSLYDYSLLVAVDMFVSNEGEKTIDGNETNRNEIRDFG
ncbi:hypothetical protein V1478_006002 [Vespula squamosa]|uniref:Uncharacterized protein n=1 Tax=Vespula squamosa TaxID=30214 RepID=A0ABD2B9I8_VESSQ